MCQRALPQPLSLEEGQAADQILSRNRAVHNLFFPEVGVSTYVQVVPQRGRLRRNQPGQEEGAEKFLRAKMPCDGAKQRPTWILLLTGQSGPQVHQKERPSVQTRNY